MVFFTCSGCGESLKKAQVEKHRFRCRRAHLMTCIDCLKDFRDDEYQAHTKCITEDQKYGGQNYVRKENKGEAKQEQWCALVQSVIDHLTSSNEDKRLKGIFEKLRNFSNVPRKQAKFANFLRSSAHIFDEELIDQAWKKIAARAEEAKQAQTKLNEKKEADNVVDENLEATAVSIHEDSSEVKQGSEAKSKTKRRRQSSTECPESNADVAETIAVSEKCIEKKKKSKKQKSHQFVAKDEESSGVVNGENASFDQNLEDTSVIQTSCEIAKQVDAGENTLSVKTLIKKLIAEAEGRRLKLKRLKKIVACEMKFSMEKAIETVDEFLRKNNAKYVTDGKIVRFVTKNET